VNAREQWKRAAPLRVAHVVTRLIAGAGGVALRAASQLDPERFESVILTAPGGSLIERAAASGIEVITLRNLRPDIAPHADVAALRELTALLEVGGFDVVHTHSAKAGAIGRLAARRAGVRTVLHTFHGFPFHAFQPALRRAAYIAVERRLARITDRLVAVSANVAAEAVRLGIAAPDQIRVIPVSISNRGSVPRDGRARARRLLGTGEGATVIGSVGRLDEQKAPQHFLEALAQLGRKDVMGVWIGDGPLRASTEARSRALGLAGRAVFLGERHDVAELLPGLDVFLMTSLYEGLPCALAEAMRAGLPVVATAVNGVPELIVAGETGLLTAPARPDMAARAVAHLLDHPAEAARMARAGERSVAGRFDPERAAGALAALYLEAAGATTPLEQLPRAS